MEDIFLPKVRAFIEAKKNKSKKPAGDVTPAVVVAGQGQAAAVGSGAASAEAFDSADLAALGAAKISTDGKEVTAGYDFITEHPVLLAWLFLGPAAVARGSRTEHYLPAASSFKPVNPKGGGCGGQGRSKLRVVQQKAAAAGGAPSVFTLSPALMMKAAEVQQAERSAVMTQKEVMLGLQSAKVARFETKTAMALEEFKFAVQNAEVLGEYDFTEHKAALSAAKAAQKHAEEEFEVQSAAFGAMSSETPAVGAMVRWLSDPGPAGGV